MQLAAAPADGRTFRILVVEDDISLAKLLLAHLQKAGFKVGVAENGERGWHYFQQEDPHLVLLDVMTGGKSGWDLAAKIRENSLAPILIVTSANSIEDQIRGLKIGADDYIPKPFHAQVLVARIVANLRRVYRYGLTQPKVETPAAPEPEFSPIQSSGIPEGWTRCDDCGYLGPQFKFEAEDSNGRRIVVCPHCKSRTMTFSLG
jgi:DNA-binding response OmpR family regulator